MLFYVDGIPPCQFTKLQNKAGPDDNGEKKESITTYDACEIECRDMNCKSFDFGLSGAVATCIIFMSDVESKVKSSASYTYFEKSSAARKFICRQHATLISQSFGIKHTLC